MASMPYAAHFILRKLFYGPAEKHHAKCCVRLFGLFITMRRYAEATMHKIAF